MVYSGQLPQLSHLVIIANHVKFPASVDDLVRMAEKLGYDSYVCNFLRLFQGSEPFSTPSEFAAKSEELELLIQEERETAPEQTREP